MKENQSKRKKAFAKLIEVSTTPTGENGVIGSDGGFHQQLQKWGKTTAPTLNGIYV